MTSGTRIVLALVVLGVLAAGFATIVWETPAEHGNRRGEVPFPRFTSSAECEECHAQVFAEWQSSHHRISYTNPEVRKLSDDFRNKECQACHLPRPILETGSGKRPLQRQARPDEGVDCFTCHRNEAGRIVGRRALPAAGCKPVSDARLWSVDLCKSCHNQHRTTDQFLASVYPKQNIDCNTCHMPEVERGGGRRGRQHVFPGCHDTDYLRTACVFRVELSGREVSVEVENVGAGHNFPTEERHRAVDVLYRITEQGREAAAAPGWTRLYRFREPYRGESGPNTQLPAHETWKGKIDLGDAEQGRVLQVRLVYKLQPFLPDSDATLLYERTVVVP